ncbi:unnamed protein product [Tetraodon nigroviridis]|uniref:(spotted green pufferfish) hypothetical protein n=1 Tax=Tetraodon nigroviridis TaxID=99883 RepID=Q4S3U9_TETNG|nr:unnamed protein product [Tetraodon nigroviridis]
MEEMRRKGLGRSPPPCINGSSLMEMDSSFGWRMVDDGSTDCPSTMPYQSPNRSPDCNSLPNLNLHADEQIVPLSNPPHPEDPPSHASEKFTRCQGITYIRSSYTTKRCG